MTETDLKNLIYCELFRRGCFVQCANYYNTSCNGPVRIGLSGHSNLCGHRPDGKAFYIKVKLPKQKPCKNQQDFLTAMQKSGALAGVAHSVKEAVEIVFGDEMKRLQLELNMAKMQKRAFEAQCEMDEIVRSVLNGIDKRKKRYTKREQR